MRVSPADSAEISTSVVGFVDGIVMAIPLSAGKTLTLLALGQRESRASVVVVEQLHAGEVTAPLG